MPLAISSTVSRLQPVGVVAAAVCGSSDLHSEPDNHPSSHGNEVWGEVGGIAGRNSERAETCSAETLRRRRIGLANKGKVPWNKGRKHSPETCARIKERTLEALRDPKPVKAWNVTIRPYKKEDVRSSTLAQNAFSVDNSALLSNLEMGIDSGIGMPTGLWLKRHGLGPECEGSREHSKRKIGSSLKKLWAERLKRKRAKEKFYTSWAESIAEAARRGGVGEELLNWDSYERLKVEIAFRRLQWVEEKAKVKDMKRIRAEKKVQKRVQNVTRVAQKKLELKQKDELRAKKKAMSRRKRREKKEELGASTELNTTDRLVKIFGKKSTDGPSCSQPGSMIYLQSALEKFDIESIKAEQRRSTVSLADQIQAAKSRRQQTVTNRSNITSSR
uniref:Nuclease associated modular domain-containing protein n=1 Tax=Chenopodium quinoa TaxID=63459 RepID=A0A803N0J0_CHEQI